MELDILNFFHFCYNYKDCL